VHEPAGPDRSAGALGRSGVSSPTDPPANPPPPQPETQQISEPAATPQSPPEPAPSLQKEAPAQPASPGYGGPWATPGSAYGPTLSSGSDYAQQPFPPGYGYPANTVGGFPLAPQTDRLLARLIDSAILFVPNFIISIVLLAVPIIVLAVSRVDQPLWYVLVYLGGFSLSLLINLGLAYYYEVIYQHNKGQTFGKQKMRIKILALETGQPPDTRALQRRYLAEYCVAIAMVIPVLGWIVASIASFYNYLNYLWCLWDKPYQQCLHDKYAKTVVIKVAE
jgi:uncharacterized RDD family membrane protein YckC